MILILDNFDSFVWNLAHMVAKQGQEFSIIRTDMINPDEIQRIKPSHILISPGPKAPRDYPEVMNIINIFSRSIPIMGICLGHQMLGEFGGALIRKAKQPSHGKKSLIHHHKTGLFYNLPSSMYVARYHSLVVEETTLFLEDWHVDAKTEDGEIMAIHHQSLPLYGLQFHPESIIAEHGEHLINNFLQLTNSENFSHSFVCSLRD
tara:strand:- start:242 stop:856 length:615 start_codon:yes stop_codon:yes gene_type:complete